jgi:hypothetical protein
LRQTDKNTWVAKADGDSLYTAAELLKIVGIIVLIVLSLILLVMAFVLAEKGGFLAFILTIGVSTVMVAVLYLALTFTINTAKVLSHLLSTCLEIASSLQDRKINSQAADRIYQNKGARLEDPQSGTKEANQTRGRYEYNYLRSNAQMRISGGGLTVKAEGEYPTMIWKIYDRGIEVKQIAELEELIRFADSLSKTR